MKTLSEYNKLSVFCINLELDFSRLRNFTKESKRIGLDYTRWGAVDGGLLDSRFLYPHMTCRQIGCYLSHLSLWQYAERNNIDDIMIFEDDCLFSDDFINEFDDFMSEDCDERQIIRLGYSGVGCSGLGDRWFEKHTDKCQIMKAPLWLAHAYILKKDAIKVLSKCSYMEADYLLFGDLPIKEKQERGVKTFHTIKNYCPMDNLCWQAGGLSSISGMNVEKPINKRLLHI